MTTTLTHHRRSEHGMRTELALIGLVVLLAAAVAALLGYVVSTDESSPAGPAAPIVAGGQHDAGLGFILSDAYPVGVDASETGDDVAVIDAAGQTLGAALASPFGPMPSTEVDHALGYLFSERFPSEVVVRDLTDAGS